MDFNELIQEWHLGLVLMAWVLSFIIGIIIVQLWKSGMNTVHPKGQASDYIVNDSLMFKEKNDRFLYSRVTKTMRQKTTASSGRR